jgi:hypothetical protein
LFEDKKEQLFPLLYFSLITTKSVGLKLLFTEKGIIGKHNEFFLNAMHLINTTIFKINYTNSIIASQ